MLKCISQEIFTENFLIFVCLCIIIRALGSKYYIDYIYEYHTVNTIYRCYIVLRYNAYSALWTISLLKTVIIYVGFAFFQTSKKYKKQFIQFHLLHNSYYIALVADYLLVNSVSCIHSIGGIMQSLVIINQPPRNRLYSDKR